MNSGQSSALEEMKAEFQQSQTQMQAHIDHLNQQLHSQSEAVQNLESSLSQARHNEQEALSRLTGDSAHLQQQHQLDLQNLEQRLTQERDEAMIAKE